jgi:hypothetical protein
MVIEICTDANRDDKAGLAEGTWTGKIGFVPFSYSSFCAGLILLFRAYLLIVGV